MYIESRGCGPDLVLIHGWAMHGGIFAPLAERLAPHFRLHVVDLPGHGRSRDADEPLRLPDIAAVIAARVPPAVWLGWSLGGLFALQAAATLPSVQGLIMMASLPRFVSAPDWPQAASKATLKQLQSDVMRDYAGALERFLALDLFDSEGASVTVSALRAALLAYGAPTATALREGGELLEHGDLRSLLPSLPVPSLWLAGRRDRLVSPASTRSAVALTAEAEFCEIAGAGHAPFLGRTDEVAVRIRDFLAHNPSP